MLDCYYMDFRGGCSKEQSLALYNALCDDRKEKVDRLKDTNIREKQILTGAFLQYCLIQYKNVDLNSMKFGYNPQGKPYLSSSDIHFNISHSGDYVVLAVSDSAVGIDIEKKRTNRLSIAKRCFCKEEYDYIVDAESKNGQDERFLEYWTIKEAYVKYTGNGLSVPLNSFCIIKDRGGYNLFEMLNGEKRHEIRDIMIYSADFFDSYRVSLCYECDDERREMGDSQLEIFDKIAKKVKVIDILEYLI